MTRRLWIEYESKHTCIALRTDCETLRKKATVTDYFPRRINRCCCIRYQL
jgi:hypothetical protein